MRPCSNWLGQLVVGAVATAALSACSEQSSSSTSTETSTPTPTASTTTAPPVAADASAGNEPISAFFGLDDALPDAAAVLCAAAPGLDGIVVVFAEPLDEPATDEFAVRIATGSVSVPVCATRVPATDPGELRTVLLIGQFGDATSDPPETVIYTSGGNSTEVEVAPLDAGPALVAAEYVDGTSNDRPELRLDERGCPQGTVTTVRVTWSGGVSTSGGGDPGPEGTASHRVRLRDASGARRGTCSPHRSLTSAIATITTNCASMSMESRSPSPPVPGRSPIPTTRPRSLSPSGSRSIEATRQPVRRCDCTRSPHQRGHRRSWSIQLVIPPRPTSPRASSISPMCRRPCW
jgi:hypothetical protein